MYDDGLSLFNQMRFDEAIENFLQDTEHKDRFLQVANCYLCKKEYDKALEYINKSIETNPKDVNNCLIKGIIQYESGEKDVGIKNILFGDLSLFITSQTIYMRTPCEKFIQALFYPLMIIIPWLIINYAIYQHIMNVHVIDKSSCYFIFMQIFILLSFAFYKWKHFEKIIFFGAMFTALAEVTCPIHQYISWFPLLIQTLGLSILGFAGLVEKDVRYQLLSMRILEHIKKYEHVENYETALNLCNIVIENATKGTDLTAYKEFKQKIEEKINM